LAYGLLHGEPTLGWRAFLLFMIGVFVVVWLFDQMARRAIKNIRKHKRSSFVGRLTRRTPRIIIRVRRLMSRARR